MEKKFKPFDRVLVRDMVIFPKWTCDFYSHYDNDTKQHVTPTMTELQDNDILPYEGNEHLVGTTDEPSVPLSEKEIQDAYWNKCTEKEKENLRKSYNVFLKEDERGKSILEQTCGKHNLQAGSPDEEVRLEQGDVIVCEHGVEYLLNGVGNVRYFSGEIHHDYVIVNPIKYEGCRGSYPYFIPFSKFNPNDMEETRKHILCVKNGRIVKYKG